jgi:hypothetical protein
LTTIGDTGTRLVDIIGGEAGVVVSVTGVAVLGIREVMP